jgi:hypothetical protein
MEFRQRGEYPWGKFPVYAIVLITFSLWEVLSDTTLSKGIDRRRNTYRQETFTSDNTPSWSATSTAT